MFPLRNGLIHVVSFPTPVEGRRLGESWEGRSDVVPPTPIHPRDNPRHRGTAPTILTVSSTDTWRAAAGPCHRVTGPTVLTAAGRAAVLPKGVWRTSCRGDREAEGHWPQKDSGPRNPSRDTETPSQGLSHPVQKQWPRATSMALVGHVTAHTQDRHHQSIAASSPAEFQHIHLPHQDLQQADPQRQSLQP